MILVTGAAGKTGVAVARALRARGARFRSLVRRADQVDLANATGAEDVLVGDMRDSGTLRTALAGVDSLYHICPNMSPYEETMGSILISAARQAKLGHFVYHSVLHPQVKAMPHHWSKMKVEAHLFESGLPFTILQPASYMQNLIAQLPTIMAQGVYLTPYPTTTQLALVDLQDVAGVAAKILTEGGHRYAIYELSGPENLNQIQVAETLSEVLGRSIRAEELPLSVWREQARSSGLGKAQIDMLSKMFHYYSRHGFCGNPSILESLLSKPATKLAGFAARIARDYHC